MTMTITCSNCGYDKNPDGSEFCDACGSELPKTSVASVAPTITSGNPTIASLAPTVVPPLDPSPEIVNNIIEIPAPSFSLQPTVTFPAPAATARLIAKQPGNATPEFHLDSSNAIIGIFDPDTGPVDIDLEKFPDSETVSRNHAEIYQEEGVWKIKDLGSTNGVFIKACGQTRFGSRITIPQSLNSGDEVAIAKIRFLFQSP
jgi:pSer/pThr/pTyr-binding forkhead associated (FHA) protein